MNVLIRLSKDVVKQLNMIANYNNIKLNKPKNFTKVCEIYKKQLN